MLMYEMSFCWLGKMCGQGHGRQSYVTRAYWAALYSPSNCHAPALTVMQLKDLNRCCPEASTCNECAVSKYAKEDCMKHLKLERSCEKDLATTKY